jgi:chromosome segregation ATPase
MYQSPLKNIEKENQILREENDMLKRELSEIKKNLMFGTSNKKEEIISTLRNTIKKEDSENKELRLKLEIFTKKNAALATLVENKEEETAFLANKIKQIELELQELRDHKVKSGEKLEKLKERINYMLKSYN